MKTYKLQALVSGFKIGQKSSDYYVAIPHKDRKEIVNVTFEGSHMAIYPSDQRVTTRTFRDKFGRGDYQLDYFKWTPLDNLFSIV